MNKPIFFWFLGFTVLVVFLFLPAFTTYFFQDDWFSFSISQATTVIDFLKFFIPRSDVIYFRPLGMQVPFFLVWKLFGINPLPFKILTLMVHFLNGYLVYQIINILVKNLRLALFATFLYLTSATHQMVFYWAATFSFILAPTFYFASFLFFLTEKSRKSFVFFCLGLLINELVITLPAIITLWLILQSKTKLIKKYWQFWFLSGAYIFVRLFISPLPKTTQYSFIQDIRQPLATLRNFMMWALNWPEEIQAQFNKWNALNPLFLTEFAPFIKTFTILTTSFIIFFLLIPMILIILKPKKTTSPNYKIILFGIGWFIVTALPVLALANHAFTYYVAIPLFGLLIVITQLAQVYLGNTRMQKIILACFLIAFSGFWYFSSLENVKLNQLIHWAPQRARRSEFIISQIQKKYPQVKKNTTFIITVDSISEVRWALGEQNALRVVYGDPSLKTYFGHTTDYFSERGITDLQKQAELLKELYLFP